MKLPAKFDINSSQVKGVEVGVYFCQTQSRGSIITVQYHSFFNSLIGSVFITVTDLC